MKKNFISTTEDRLLVGFLGVLFLLSLAIPTVESLTKFNAPDSWSTPVILAALIAILRLVGAVPEIRTHVRYLRDHADVRVQRMSNVTEYYDALNHAVSTATSTLDLTHIRDTPPADFGEQAEMFFSNLTKWCETEPHYIRRIISVRNPAMLEWARLLAKETEHLSRFDVRVVDWSIDAPALNMAIVDNKAVYLALTGATAQKTRGLGIEDAQEAQYFSDYYDNLWREGTDLQKWILSDSVE